MNSFGKILIGLTFVAAFLYVLKLEPRTDSSVSDSHAVATQAGVEAPTFVEKSTEVEDPTDVETPTGGEASAHRVYTNDCTADCSGHRAGYNWAEEKGVDDEDACETAGENSNSPSFAEGCKEFVDDGANSEDSKEDDDN